MNIYNLQNIITELKAIGNVSLKSSSKGLTGMSSNFLLDERTDCLGKQEFIFTNREYGLEFVLLNSMADLCQRIAKNQHVLDLTILDQYLPEQTAKTETKKIKKLTVKTKTKAAKQPRFYQLALANKPDLDELIPERLESGSTDERAVTVVIECRNKSLERLQQLTSYAQRIIRDWKREGRWTQILLDSLNDWSNQLYYYQQQFTEAAIPVCCTELLLAMNLTAQMIQFISTNLSPLLADTSHLTKIQQALQERYSHYLDKEYWQEMLRQNKENHYQWSLQHGLVEQIKADLDLFAKKPIEKAGRILHAILEKGTQMNRIREGLYNFDRDFIDQASLLMQASVGYNDFAHFLCLSSYIRALKEMLLSIYKDSRVGKDFDLALCAQVLLKMEQENLFQLKKKENHHLFLLLAVYIQNKPPTKFDREKATQLMKSIGYDIANSIFDTYLEDYWNLVNSFNKNESSVDDMAGPLIFVFIRNYVEMDYNRMQFKKMGNDFSE